MNLKLDSLLGATLQETLYSESSKRIVHYRSGNAKDKIVRIQGRAILSNNVVSHLKHIETYVSVFPTG